jgi:hypothetical protein
MKLKSLVLGAALTVSAAAPLIYAAHEDTRTTLASFPAAELPRESAKMVKNVKGEARAARCVDIVRTAVELNHASAPAIVGAASRVAPDLAVEFSSVAATIEPKLAAGIARAAAAAAPNYASEIALGVIKTRPALYAQIAYEVSYAVPGKDAQIANAVVTGLPNLKGFTSSPATLTGLLAATPQVDKAARQLGMKTDEFVVTTLTPTQASTVQTAFATTSTSGASFAPLAAGGVPSQKGVPFVPGAGTPGEENRAQTVVVTPGEGRTYDKPGNGPKDKNDDGKPGNGPKS